VGAREELQRRFEATVATERARPEALPLPEGWPALQLPPALRESLVAAAELAGGRCPESAAAYYCERMPRALFEQLYRRGEPAHALLWRPLDLSELPRLRAALDGLYLSLRACELDPQALLGAATPGDLLAARGTVAALHAHALFGSGLPMVGAWPAERDLLAQELAAGRDPDALIDLRLSGNLVHELCHGPPREPRAPGPPPPWLVLEAAALELGASAFPRHVYPDEPGEAVPGVSLFTLVGQGLRRLFGARALFSLLVEPRPLALAFAPRAAALEVAEWQRWLRSPEPPFARDALRALDFLKLAALCEASAAPLPALEQAAASPPLEAARSAPDVLDLAARVPWSETPWWGAVAGPRDLAMVPVGVRALFQVNVAAPTYQTHPAAAPGGRLLLDVEACALRAAPRAAGVFGEPARWIFPPPLARSLWERGARRVRVEGALRRDADGIAQALIELSLGARPLPADAEVRWTSSP
jgi:hypothetical protein